MDNGRLEKGIDLQKVRRRIESLVGTNVALDAGWDMGRLLWELEQVRAQIGSMAVAFAAGERWEGPSKGVLPMALPQIPHLAQGAVLPANEPFLAMVGDQRHGVNVETPLVTIQEAVSAVMEDVIASDMAGHEATVAMLRQILEAVMGIQIGDEVIGRAAQRYDAKMAIVKGGM